ncbi:MAG: sensor histidine kinase [Gammaproteobacteria bacterium]
MAPLLPIECAALHPGRRRGAARPRYRSPPGAGGGLGHGLGYPPERLLYIFDRFYHSEDTPPEKSRSAGLGLAIVKRILELHGSAISVVSNPAAGTTFSFDLR